MQRSQLETDLNQLLLANSFEDYCPNGLQIEGVECINKIAFAVSATRDSIEQTIKEGADTLIVHHGLFWKFHGAKTITGSFAKRIRPLIQNNINLFAYHLPLDGHPDRGNAAVLGDKIGCIEQTGFGEYKGKPTGIKGRLASPMTAEALKSELEKILDHPVILASPNIKQQINNIGIITGGANSQWMQAHQEGLDAYLTGEISEHDWHESQESGIHMFAGGHNATERFGILSLKAYCEQKFQIETCFIDSENPA